MMAMSTTFDELSGRGLLTSYVVTVEGSITGGDCCRFKIVTLALPVFTVLLEGVSFI